MQNLDLPPSATSSRKLTVNVQKNWTIPSKVSYFFSPRQSLFLHTFWEKSSQWVKKLFFFSRAGKKNSLWDWVSQYDLNFTREKKNKNKKTHFGKKKKNFFMVGKFSKTGIWGPISILARVFDVMTNEITLEEGPKNHQTSWQTNKLFGQIGTERPLCEWQLSPQALSFLLISWRSLTR